MRKTIGEKNLEKRTWGPEPVLEWHVGFMPDGVLAPQPLPSGKTLVACNQGSFLCGVPQRKITGARQSSVRCTYSADCGRSRFRNRWSATIARCPAPARRHA